MKVIVDSKILAYTEALQHGDNILHVFTKLDHLLVNLEYAGLIGKQFDLTLAFYFGKSHYRERLYPPYKKHRTAGHKDKTPEELADYHRFQREYREILPELAKRMGVRVLGVDGVEADDLISIVALEAAEGEKVLVISEDHDLYQLALANGNIAIYLPSAMRLMTRREIITSEGVFTKGAFLIKKAILGDNGDGIKGVVRCGEVCFRQWLPEPTSYGPWQKDMWGKQFVRLCESSPKFTIHDLYVAQGITTFEQLFELNWSLGETMTDFRHFSDHQLNLFRECFKGPYQRDSRTALTAFLRETWPDAVDDFGKPLSMPVYVNF